MRRHVECMLELQSRGAITFDYGNNIRARAQEKGLAMPLAFPVSCRPISVPCSVKARAIPRAALSGDPARLISVYGERDGPCSSNASFNDG